VRTNPIPTSSLTTPFPGAKRLLNELQRTPQLDGHLTSHGEYLIPYLFVSFLYNNCFFAEPKPCSKAVASVSRRRSESGLEALPSPLSQPNLHQDNDVNSN